MITEYKFKKSDIRWEVLMSAFEMCSDSISSADSSDDDDKDDDEDDDDNSSSASDSSDD